MGLSTGNSSLGARGLATAAMSLNVGTSSLGSGGLRTSTLAALTPTQALVASFQAQPGLVDALLLFDPAHYSAPGNTPGHLVDALGGDIYYDAPNTQATPTAMQDASGYCYASSDGVDDILTSATASTQIAWGMLVARWTSFQGYFPTTMKYDTGSDSGYIIRQSNLDTHFKAGTSVYDANGAPSIVGSTSTIAPTMWSIVELGPIIAPYIGYPINLFGSAFQGRCAQLSCAAVAIRYATPTTVQRTAILNKLTVMQQALLASA